MRGEAPATGAGQRSTAITLGRGLKRNEPAERRRLGSNPIEEIRAHLAAHAGMEAWWSPHTWAEDRRGKDRWEASVGIAVDLDCDGHQRLPVGLGDQAIAALEQSANLAHVTPHGVRVFYALSDPLTDPEEFDRAARGAAQLVVRSLRDAGVQGLEVDLPATSDRARVFLAPNATARCKKRHPECGDGKREAEVVGLRREPWDYPDLASQCPSEPRGKRKRHKKLEGTASGPILANSDELLQILLAEGGEWVGDEVRFRCWVPGHEDRDPSATFCPEKETWFCFACGQGSGWMDLAELRGFRPLPRELRRERRGEGGTSPNKRPDIVYRRDGEDTPLHVLRPQAERALVRHFKHEIFQRGGDLVELAPQWPVGADRSSAGPSLKIVRITQPCLRERFDAAARWTRKSASDKSRAGVEKNAPMSVVKALHELSAWKLIPVIAGVIEAPAMRPDGSLIEKPGFDKSTGLYLKPRYDYPRVPRSPGRKQVRDALEALLHPFAEFEFATPADRASLLALLLTVAARHAIEGPVPHWAITSPAYGTGKSLLANAVATAMTGVSGEVLPPPVGRLSDAEAETRKRITSVLLDPPRVAVIDNIPDGSMLESSVLANLLTSRVWTDRLLGKAERVSLPNIPVWISTGCNYTLKADIARRSLSVRIDPGVEKPEEREFEIEDLLRHSCERHPQLLTAAFTVLRGYMAEGKPRHGGQPIGSFEEWDHLIRGAVVWATRLIGEPLDPRLTQQRLQEAAPDRTGHAELAAAWHAVFGDQPVLAKQVVGRAKLGSPLAEAIESAGCTKDGRPCTRRLGNHLRSIQDRIVLGFVFRSAGTRQHAALWRVEQQGPGESRGSGAAPSTQKHQPPHEPSHTNIEGGSQDSRDSQDSHLQEGRSGGESPDVDDEEAA